MLDVTPIVTAKIDGAAAGSRWSYRANDPEPGANIRWGVTFVDPRAHDLTGVPLGVTLHPTQIYHGLADLALFCMLVTLYPRKRVHGTIFWTYVLAYAILRFIIEFYRGDYRGEVLGGLLSTSQLVGVLAVAVSTFFLLRLRSAIRPS